MAQPDFNLYPTFTNAMGSGTMSYYYRDGRVYINNSENKDELKSIDTGNATLQRRATQIKAAGTSMSTFTTSLGNTISNLDFNDELWLNHNYVDNVNWNSRTPASVENSWWYDVDKHREYRVWLHVRYNNSGTIGQGTSHDWRVVNAFVEYNSVTQDNTAGTFRFTSTPEEAVTITGTLQFESSNRTWPTMSAVLYRGTPGSLPGSVLATETFMSTAAVDEEVEVSIELDPAQISVNDTITLAAEVNGTSGQITAIAAPLRVTSYELSVEGDQGEYTPGGPVDFGGLGESLDLSDDCNPLLNNVGGARSNEKLQIVEFSESQLGEGSLIPSNLESIRSGSATKAAVPESNYTSLAFNRNRYVGSKFTRDNINSTSIPNDYQYEGRRDEITDVDDGTLGVATPDVLGGIPVATLQDVHLGYYSRIIDPYPTLNGKTAYFVKYLMNDQNVVQDPSLSEIGRINFINTFKTRDINGDVTRVQPVIQDRENAPELGDLESTSNLFKVGEFPYPILYSQNSATTFTETLPLTGSTNFFTSEEVDINTYQNYAFNTSDNSLTNSFPIQSILRNPINIPETTLIPSAINGIGVNNISNAIFNEGGFAIQLPNTDLTDQYTLEGTFTFYTTALPGRHSRNINNRGRYAGNAYFTVERNGSNFLQGDYTLNITGQSNVTAGGTPVNYPHPSNPMSLRSGTKRPYGGETDTENPFERRNNEIYLPLHTDVHEYGLRSNGYPHNNTVNPTQGYRIKWEINFTIPSTYITSGDTFNFKFRSQDSRRVGNVSKDDYAGEANPSWQRSISPDIPVGQADQPTLSLSLLGRQTQNVQVDDLNSVNFPYWEKPSGTTNQIRLISNQLNDFYGGDYYQGDLNYQHGVNADFPLAQEPNFLQFGPVRNRWSLEVGDEFRFENDENKVFTVTAVDDSGTQLLVTFDREISSDVNLNFFLIRRYENAPNIIILDQPKPYTVPASASSSPGILLPEFRIESLETDPDAVITDLIERRLI